MIMHRNKFANTNLVRWDIEMKVMQTSLANESSATLKKSKLNLISLYPSQNSVLKFPFQGQHGEAPKNFTS